MAESELNVDSIISRLLEGKSWLRFLSVFVAKVACENLELVTRSTATSTHLAPSK